MTTMMKAMGISRYHQKQLEEFVLPIPAIAPDEVLAIGDGENDLTMLQFAGMSAAPANACEQARKLAGWIAPSNNESAGARALEHYHII